MRPSCHNAMRVARKVKQNNILLTSDQARLPAELKSIDKRRKRN